MSRCVCFYIININSIYAILPLIHLSDIHLKDPIGNKWKRFHVSTFEVGQLPAVFFFISYV